MLQVIESYKAIRTPCGSCRTKKDRTLHPDCADFCPPLNDYLRLLGIPKRVPQKPVKLTKELLPKSTYFVSKELLTTHEQFLEGHKTLRAIKEITKFTDKQLGEKLGIKTGVIRSINQGKNQKTMRKEHYEAIMAWGIEVGI